MTSHIILQRKYRHLEALVRSAFEPAEDVKVVIDRRKRKRRASTLPPTTKDRRCLPDRRCAAPFMDILIDASG